jgi:signal peptidase II
MKAVPLSRSLVFLLIAGTGCAVDLLTKKLIFDWLDIPPNSHTHWFWTNVVGLQTSLNEGALFGLGQGQVPVFATLSVAAAAGILIWVFYGGGARDWHLTIALGCVMAGILGNLYDRLGLPGLIWDGLDGVHAAGQPVRAVRDFVLVKFWGWSWPNFNVADSLLVCGAILLLWHAFRKPREPAANTNAEETNTEEIAAKTNAEETNTEETAAKTNAKETAAKTV